MRYYLIIGDPLPALLDAMPTIEATLGLKCLGIIKEMAGYRKKLLGLYPELILVHLDHATMAIDDILRTIGHDFGKIPHYIGVTASVEKGFEAFKAGFLDVILASCTREDLLSTFTNYKYTYEASSIFCIEEYYDFHYINLHNVLFIQADNYTTDFIMKDGSLVHNFKNLKHTFPLLPKHFQKINRGQVINSFYVFKINMGRKELFLRHHGKPLRYTRKYKTNISIIKKWIQKTPITIY